MLDEKLLIKMGIASLLPGIRVVRDLLDAQEAEYRQALDILNNGGDLSGLGLLVPKRRGRPPKASTTLLNAVAAALPAAPPESKPKRDGQLISSRQNSYWANMTAEQRAAEVARRMKGAQTKKAKKPSGTTRTGTKPKGTYGWAGMTPEQRSAEMRRRVAVHRGLAPSRDKKKRAAA